MSAEIKPIVWTIASSDSGGGAGIQADLKTFSALNCHGCSVIAAVTAQNSHQVVAYEAVSVALFDAQLNCLLEDMPPQVIKIGLIPDQQLLLHLAHWLAQHKLTHNFTVIADPVLSTSSGYDFIKRSELVVWRQKLLPLIDLLTPNLPELALLSAAPELSALQQAKLLLHTGVNGILIKGGHADKNDQVVDTYISATTQFNLSHCRLSTRHTHGTGCVLSSAISAALAHDYPLSDALVLGRAYLHQALSESYAAGQGPGSLPALGWPAEQRFFPQLQLTARSDASATSSVSVQSPSYYFSPIEAPIGLYPVVDNVEWLARLAPLGLDVVQLRLKKGSMSQIEQQIIAAVALGRDYNLRLFINDYWQLAIKHHAYGVHLGQEDLNTADLTKIAQSGLRLGVSTHGYFELIRALQISPSYIALGHIYPTTTKQMPSKPQGLQRLTRYVGLCTGIPTVAIGGINDERINDVLNCGVDGVAVVSAITGHAQPEQAFSQLKRCAEQHYAHYH